MEYLFQAQMELPTCIIQNIFRQTVDELIFRLPWMDPAVRMDHLFSSFLLRGAVSSAKRTTRRRELGSRGSKHHYYTHIFQ